MRRVSRTILLVIAVLIVVSLVWSRLRLIVFIPITLGQALLLFGVGVAVIYLGLDHLLNRDR